MGKKAKAGKGTSTKKAGLKFSAGAMGGNLKRGRFAKRVSKAGAVYLAAAIEYCTSELLELATKAAAKAKKTTLKPRHIALAVRNDDELNKLLASVTIASGGVVPNCTPPSPRRSEHGPAPTPPRNRLHPCDAAVVSLDTGPAAQ